MVIYVCWVCSKVYEKKRRSLNCYCSDKCRKKEARGNKNIVHIKRCRMCHKDFKTRRSDALTCSVKCRKKRNRILKT